MSNAGRASKVPQYTFPDTLKEQQRALKTNPLLERMKSSRKAMANDPHRPVYHYVNPEGPLNDPNGLCFWQGRWHLFYQAFPPEDTRQHWGHAVSEDLVHWEDLPIAIYPDPEDKCFSGSTMVEDDRVIAIYHGIDAGTMVAVSSDPLLLNWEKVTGKAVIPLARLGEPPLPYNIFDPCIWKQGDYYYALTAGTRPIGPGDRKLRAEFLHRSRDLASWEYLHQFLEDDYFGLVGEDGACPYFWPIGDKHILLHFSHYALGGGGKYMLGHYDTTRNTFVVTNGGEFNFGPVGPGGVHAPSAFPDGNGGVIALFNMNPAKPCEGWDQIMTVPRRLTLLEDDRLGIEPVEALKSLRGVATTVPTMTLPANENVVLDQVSGNAMEIAAEIDTQGAPMVEMDVLCSPDREEYTRIVIRQNSGNYRKHSTVTIDNTRSSSLPDVQCRPPETAPLPIGATDLIQLHVFVDRSVVEVFVNGLQCVALRVYPGRKDSVSVSLRSQGKESKLVGLTAWQMENIYE
jgi:beta-fructofuranosidase